MGIAPLWTKPGAWLPPDQALIFAILLFAVGVPINYYTDRFLYRRRLAMGEAEGTKKR